MSLKKAGCKSRWQRNQWVGSVVLLVTLLLISFPSNAKEKEDSNRLPPAPDTGAPTEDSSAGGTRDNRDQNLVCGVEAEQITYLLGSENREFTLSAHPTFWFYIPTSLDQEARLKFAVKELETGKEIYAGSPKRTKSSIMGINLPKQDSYALSPEKNYVWSLKIDCAEANQESEIALLGWVTRLSSSHELQNQLAISQTEKYRVYLEHNIWYDALTELAQLRIAKPDDVRVENEWNQFLIELGWSELVQQTSLDEPSISLLPISY